jgi:menaquinone-9 beta-reductase
LKDVVIIGGGIAGLTNAILLARAGIDVTLVEKKQYPFHKVCGEYVSNETLPFLRSLDINPLTIGAVPIENLVISTAKGTVFTSRLTLGGFGWSRYAFDNILYQKAIESGAKVLTGISVKEFNFDVGEDCFHTRLSDGSTLQSKILIGSYGKRSALDRQLNRPFFAKRSPYVAVKYHIYADHPANTIALHLFKAGYCGINQVEDNRLCLCYLSTRESLKKAGSIEQLEKQVLGENKLLKDILQNSDRIYEFPEVINEVSFASKETVVNHTLMCGDAAGMIAPLCGNGMAMAMHSAKICSALVTSYFKNHHNRFTLEQDYTSKWQSVFSGRLSRGRAMQNVFYMPWMMDIAIGAAKIFPFVGSALIRQTHGEVF